MKLLYSIVLLFLLASCNTLKVATDKNSKNVSSIGIQTNYWKRADNIYKDTVEAVIENFIKRFNAENHLFSVHKKTKNDKAFITLDFSKIKIVSNGGVIAGYIVSGLGLLVAPIAVYELSEKSYLLAFYYFPINRIDYQATLSPYLNDIKGKVQRISVQTGAMFKKKSRRISATKEKFDAMLYKTFLNLENQLKVH